MWPIIFYVCLTLSLLWLVGHRIMIREIVELRRQRLDLMREMIVLSLDHQNAFREMISRVHHQGVVPISASALEVSKCIIALLKLQDAQDWKTHSVTSELSRMMAEEITLLALKLKELNDEVKRTANEYSRYQYNGHPDNDIRD